MEKNTPINLDFLVVGAEKSGTTWLADMLKQHPQIYIPEQKELHYFNRKFVEFPELDNYNYDKPISWYWKFFGEANPDQLIGEICPSYLWDTHAPARIFAISPDVKIRILLRNPIERTYSAYRFYVQRGTVNNDFRQAIKSHQYLLVYRSVYYEQVKRYIDIFPRNNIQFYLYDELQQNAETFLRKFEVGLGIDEFLPPNINERSYVTGQVRYRKLNVFLSQLRYFVHWCRLTGILDLGRKIGIAFHLEKIRQENKAREQPTKALSLDDGMRSQLRVYFKDDIDSLESLIEIDLSAWR